MSRKRKYKFSKGEVIDKWAKYHPLVTTWLARYSKKNFKAFCLWMFCDWAKLTPEELLALKADPKSLKAERLLDRFVADKDFDIPNSVRWNVANTVKGFFSANYKDLARKAGSIELQKIKPYNKPTKDDLQNLYDACYNPRDRSMVVSLPNSSAIAKGSIVQLKWKHIEEGWENIDVPHISLPPELIKGRGRGKYKGVRQETFLTPEAKEDLLKYKRWMERVKGVEFTPESNVYLRIDEPYESLTESALGKIVWDIAKRADVQYSLHDARRYVQTALEEAKINPNWARKIRGRKVRGEESPYSRPAIEELREAYRSALTYLMFRTKPDISERQKIVEELQRKIFTGEHLTEEDFALAKRHRIRFVTRHLRHVKEHVEKEDPNDCQRIVNEDKLEPYLQKGWRVQAVLPSGKVVIER